MREKVIAFFEELGKRLGLEDFYVKTLDGKVEAIYGPHGIVVDRYRHTVVQTGEYGPLARPWVSEEAEVALRELASAPQLFVRWTDWEGGLVREAVVDNPFRGED